MKNKIKLTKNQKEILNFLTNENLSPKEIAEIKNCSLQAVYKTIRQLKNKGFLEEKKYIFTHGEKKFAVKVITETKYVFPQELIDYIIEKQKNQSS